MKSADTSIQTYKKGEILISTDRSLLQVDLVHDFLTHSYWAKGIPREAVVRSIENSLCFGLYVAQRQVGFARVISDFATFAYPPTFLSSKSIADAAWRNG